MESKAVVVPLKTLSEWPNQAVSVTWNFVRSLKYFSKTEVGINSLVVRMIISHASFRTFTGLVVVCISLMSAGCMKPSVRDNAADLQSGGGSSLTIWHDSFEAARQQALVSGKPILADFTGSDWCGWCVKLKKDVFNKAEFEKWARENVVLLELDYPQRSHQASEIKAQNEKLASLYSIDSYPTVLLIDAQGNELARTGYHRDPEAFIGSLQSQL